jgi:hypothetical protein
MIRIIFIVLIVSILAGCQEKTYQLSDVMKNVSPEYRHLQLSEEAEVIDLGKALQEDDTEKVLEFVELTGQVQVKEISSKEAKVAYEEIYQDSRNGEEKILSASLAVDEESGQGFFIYMGEDGRIFATHFENSIGERHYVNATDSTALYNAAEDYYNTNLEAGEEVQVLDSLE